MKNVNGAFSLLLFLLSTFLIASGFFVFELNAHGAFGFSSEEPGQLKDAVIRCSILAIATMGGILSKMIYDEIDSTTNESFRILTVFKKTINSRHAWMAILVCPIIIISFYNSIDKIENYGLIGLLAYQNGFFFKSVLNKKTETAVGKENEKK